MSDDDELEIESATAGDTPADPSAVDARAYTRKANARELLQLEAKQFWTWALSSPIGRREIYGILKELHFGEVLFACGPNGFPNRDATMYAAGETASGQRIFNSLVIFDRDGAFKMLDEHDPRFQKPKQPKRSKKAE